VPRSSVRHWTCAPEIWRYAPLDDHWERVFKAPNDHRQATASRSRGELGLRGMVVYDGRADQRARRCS
jgi:hypothetical protein